MHLSAGVSLTFCEVPGGDPTLGCRPEAPLQGHKHEIQYHSLPPASRQSQGPRQPTGAQEGDADRPGQGEKGAHDLPGFLMPPPRKKSDRSHFIHFFWFTESKSESSGGGPHRGRSLRYRNPDSLCVQRGGVTHCLTKVSCDIKHGLRPANTDLRPLSTTPPRPPAPLISNLKCRFGLNTKYLLPTRTEHLHTRLH